MKKQDVITFFDQMASNWDADMIKEEWKLNQILDCAGVVSGCTVLDVACGTGVLIPEYMTRDVKKVIGIDISPEMIRIAKEKFDGVSNVTFCCGDAEETDFEELFDCIVVYNAFPHFCDPHKLIRSLADKLKKGGKLTIAHGMSREQIDRCHSGAAENISNGLIHADEMEKLFEPYFLVTVKVSDENIYVVSGTKI